MLMDLEERYGSLDSKLQIASFKSTASFSIIYWGIVTDYGT